MSLPSLKILIALSGGRTQSAALGNYASAGGMSVSKMQAFFFDRERVINAMDKAKLKALSRMGAFVRTSARSSLRYRKKPSRPGQPPSVHRQDGGSFLKDWLFFAYDRSRGSVVVGPALLNRVTFSAADIGSPRVLVPELLEKGGTAYTFEIFRGGEWERADLRSRRRIARYSQRFRAYRMAARPYMRPALDKERPKFAGMFRDSITR